MASSRDISNLGVMSGLGGIGAGLFGMFGSQNPYDSASKYYNQIPGMLQGMFNPYMQMGQQAGQSLQGQYGQLAGLLPGLMQQYGNLAQNPGAVMSQIGAGYQQSPGFQFQLNQGMNAAKNAAASGGMAGSPQAQQNAATMATGLANQDYYNYLNKALGLYGQGLQGQQGLYGAGLQGLQGLQAQGYDATNQLGGGLMQALMNQGNLAFAGQAAQNQQQGSAWGDLFGGLGALGSFGGSSGLASLLPMIGL